MLSKRLHLWTFFFALAVTLITVPRAKRLESPDFKVFYVAAQQALHSPATLYKVSPDRYLYPPSAAILLAPFSFSSHYGIHQWLWHGLLGLIVWYLAGQNLAAFAAMAVLIRYLAITFGYGQINLVVMGLMALSASLLARYPARAGAVWAMAVGFKIFPLVMAPLFLQRPWKSFFWEKGRYAWAGAFFSSAFLLFLPLLFFGPSLGLQLYTEFLGALRDKGLPLHSHNQSLCAFFLRLFTDQSFYLHAVGEIRWAFLHLKPSTAQSMAYALSFLATFFTWRKVYLADSKGKNVLGYLSAASFSFLFLSHLVWKDYFLFLFFPLREIFSRSPLRFSILAASLYLVVVTLSGPDLVGHQISTRLDAGCVHLWAAVLVWIAWWKSFRFPY